MQSSRKTVVVAGDCACGAGGEPGVRVGRVFMGGGLRLTVDRWAGSASREDWISATLTLVSVSFVSTPSPLAPASCQVSGAADVSRRPQAGRGAPVTRASPGCWDQRPPPRPACRRSSPNPCPLSKQAGGRALSLRAAACRFSRRSRTARGARRWRRMERSVSGGGAGRYLPVRSRCLHPGQQQGRRWPSSSSSWVRRMRRSRVISCLASSTQQMNSFRARGVMSFQASSAVGLAISALRRSAGRLCTTPPGTRWLLTGPR